MTARMEPIPIHASVQECTEDQLVERAAAALSACNWTIGECAAAWTRRYAKGRTDADFGNLIGMSGDQVYERRRVFESFADVSGTYRKLKFSHFKVALSWDDAAECLQWADEMEATVAEMKAWRRAQHGEDLSQPPEDDEEQFTSLNPQPSTLNELKEDPVAAGTKPGKTPQPAVSSTGEEENEDNDGGEPARPVVKVPLTPPSTHNTEPSTPYEPGNIEQLLDGIEHVLERFDRDMRRAYAQRLRAIIARLEADL